jgi:hypothetical protein
MKGKVLTHCWRYFAQKASIYGIQLLAQEILVVFDEKKANVQQAAILCLVMKAFLMERGELVSEQR